MSLRLAWYGDDFTGASDTLATLAEAGLRALLFLDVPTPERLASAGPLDAIGIAGAARAMAPDEMRRALAPIADFFATCGAPVLQYKCCSTFDSAAGIGSIGVAVETLRARLANPFIPILGGQPSLGRYCLFGQLFATAEAGGPAYRIDRHPTMRQHPVTPMHEADLALHLAKQGLAPIASIDWRAYGGPLDAPHSPVLFDVGEDAHLAVIGRLIAERSAASPVLAVGASSVAQAMIDHWGLDRHAVSDRIAPAEGPVLVLAGSLSPVSAAQVAAAERYRRVPLDPVRLAGDDGGYAGAMTRGIADLLASGQNVLAHLTLTDTPKAALPGLAPACGRLLRAALRLSPVARVGVAGGDTSSHAVQALAPWGLSWLGRVGPGVALCRLRADDPTVDGVEIMLKGGQMGGPGLFDALVAGT